MAKAKDQRTLMFNDFDDLFGVMHERAQEIGAAPVLEIGDQATSTEPEKTKRTEPCTPEGCEHSDEEHEAFDDGVKAGEQDVDIFDNPYAESSLQEAWLSGHSIGEMNRNA